MMRKIFSALTFLAITALPHVSLANINKPLLPTITATNNSATNIKSTLDFSVNEALIERLSERTTWQRLLLYKNGKSGVLSDSFFVSPQGKTDAKAELLANLQALQSAKTAEDYLCRFPARSAWLMAEVPSLAENVDALLGFHECQQVNDWLSKINATQLSLIYAEEHVNRMASAFGHTLIRVDNPQSLATHDTDLAYFINFATDNSQHGSPLSSAFDAVRGHGKGAMTFGNYTDKQANYLIKDERDIWQYTLKLSNADIRQMMRHFWEVKDVARHYNFLSNNCASEILRLLDIVSPQDNFVNDAGKIISPAEVSRMLAKKGVLANEQFIPSHHTLEQAKHNDKYADKNEIMVQQSDIDNYAKNAQLTTLPKLIPTDNNPLNATRLHRANLSVLHSDARDKPKFLLGVRGGYQDLLDNPTGKRDFLNLTTLSVQLSHDADKTFNRGSQLQIHDATLLDITMFNPKNGTTPKATLGGHLKITPIVDGSYQQTNEHRVLSVGGEYGSSWLIGKGKAGSGELPNTLCYGLAMGQGQIGRINNGFRIGVGVHTGCVHHLTPKLRVLADAQLPYWFHELDGSGGNDDNERNHYFQPIVSLTGQYDIGKQTAVRAGVSHQRNHEQNDINYLLSYHWFFD